VEEIGKRIVEVDSKNTS